MFKDRHDAGSQLAKKLKSRNYHDPVVYALPRGGVPLGRVIADELGCPLDLVIVRKVGHSHDPEYAICAVAETGEALCSEAADNVDQEWLQKAIKAEKSEAKRRRRVYLEGRKPVSPKNKTAIIVDDGIATGLTMLAAIALLKKSGAKRIVIAVPVLPLQAADMLKEQVDDMVAIQMPEVYMGSVGMYYEKFDQLADEQVKRLLR